MPANTAFVRISLNNGEGNIPDDHNIVVYSSNNEVSPIDDIRPYILHKNLKGMRGSNEIFDYYAPTTLDKEILQMAKYAAVRDMNFCNNTIRIGTFNMYNPRGTNGWETTRKMLKDYAIDISGFQEVSALDNHVLTEYLKGWEFTDGATDSPVAIASHFTVLSHNTYTTTETERKYMKCVIQLPRYADAVNPTLSIYTYHGVVTSEALRLAEIQEILGIIADDTSDFIVIVGDTNSFDSSHAEWQVWNNAGFTPVHDGNGIITTADDSGYSLDNIFYGTGITCQNYHVVPAKDYMISINGGTPVPLSDHDFLFADLKFDFGSLLS